MCAFTVGRWNNLFGRIAFPCGFPAAGVERYGCASVTTRLLRQATDSAVGILSKAGWLAGCGAPQEGLNAPLRSILTLD